MRVRPTRLRRLRIRKAIGNATLIAAILAVAALYVAVEKNITLVVNGQPQSIRTLSANVGQLLDTTGIVLDGQDVVQPPPSTPLADGMTVVVDTQTLDLTASGSHADVGVWVVDGTDNPASKLVAASVEGSPSAGVTVGTSRVVGARVVVKGKAHDIVTNANTVRALLSAMGITPDRSDRIHPSPSTPLHPSMLVRYVDVDLQNDRVVHTIPYRTLTTYSSTLAPGTVRITQGGSDGRLLEIYRVTRVDGRIVSRDLVERRVLEPAEPRRQVIGRAESSQPQGTETGDASWYYAPGSDLTAAHPWLPFGTVVTVTNLANGKTVQVVINDRGPFGGRIIDLSPEAFSTLAPLGTGVLHVQLTW